MRLAENVVDSKLYVENFSSYLLTEKLTSPHTHEAYRRDVLQFTVFLSENGIALSEAKQEDVRAFVRHLSSKGMQAASVGRKISSIKAFYNYLNSRFGFFNPATSILFPKKFKGLPKSLSSDEIEKLLNYLSEDTSHVGKRNSLLVTMMYATGIRVTELVSLKLHNLNLGDGFITVVGKGNKERVVPMALGLKKAIMDYLEVDRPALLGGGLTSGYLFPIQITGKVSHITRQAIWFLLRRASKAAGLEKPVSPHQLRHSIATHMLKEGANLRSLQMLLGHENISTVEIYTHVDRAYIKKVYDEKHPRAR